VFLLIDWGNTQLKYILLEELSAVTLDASLSDINRVSSPVELIDELRKRSVVISTVLVASVRNVEDNTGLSNVLTTLNASIFFAETSSSACGIQCAYQNPSKLGVDRWLAMLALSNKVSCDCCAIIDIGSAITLDIIGHNGKHLGGHIIPGNNLVRRSLNDTGKVRFAANNKPMQEFRLGRSTDECVHFGIDAMYSSYLTHVISSSISEYGITRCYVTGGGSYYWQSFLKDFAKNAEKLEQMIFVEHLVFVGLANLYKETAKY
jgi:type III pantothenate kinase